MSPTRPDPWRTGERYSVKRRPVEPVPGRRQLGELARGLVLRALASDLPIAWVIADSAHGRERGLRRMLEETGRQGVGRAAIAAGQVAGRDLAHWPVIGERPVDAWQRLSCGDGAKGPRVCHWAAAQLPVIDIFKASTRLCQPIFDKARLKFY